MSKLKTGNPRVQYRCSFCGKGQEGVHRLIAGPGGVYICNECVDLCNQIFAEESKPPSVHEPPQQAARDAADDWIRRRAFSTAQQVAGFLYAGDDSSALASTERLLLDLRHLQGPAPPETPDDPGTD